MSNIVKGYKAFDKGLKCRDFQFVEGETFEHKGSIEPCNSGFHFCENPLDVLNYYDLCDSEFAEVEAIGNVKKDKDKSVTDKLKIGVKLGLPGLIKASIDYVRESCTKDNVCSDDNNKRDAKLASSGDYAQLASSGYSAQLASSGDSAQLASSGDSAKLASSGDSAQLASSGDYAQLASSGDYAQLASSGDYAKLASSGYSAQLASSGDSAKLEVNGQYSIGAGIGYDNKIKGVIGSWIVLAEWEYDNKLDEHVPMCVKSAKIDGKKLKENVWYKLQNGKFVEV